MLLKVLVHLSERGNLVLQVLDVGDSDAAPRDLLGGGATLLSQCVLLRSLPRACPFLPDVFDVPVLGEFPEVMGAASGRDSGVLSHLCTVRFAVVEVEGVNDILADSFRNLDIL